MIDTIELQNFGEYFITLLQEEEKRYSVHTSQISKLENMINLLGDTSTENMIKDFLIHRLEAERGMERIDVKRIGEIKDLLKDIGELEMGQP